MNKLIRIIERLGLRRRSYSLNELDLKLLKWLDFRNGYFVECGANNGLSQSNTKYYERYLGWKGLLIEPIPQLAAACRKNRPGCIVEQFALVANDFTGTEIEMRYCNLMSVVAGAMKSAEAEEGHIKAGCAVQKIESYPVKVPVSTLSALLDRNKCPVVDLLSLDVEGFEAPALRGIDFNRHRPRFILVEARFPADIEEVLRGKYERVGALSEMDVLYASLRP